MCDGYNMDWQQTEHDRDARELARESRKRIYKGGSAPSPRPPRRGQCRRAGGLQRPETCPAREL